MLIYIIATQFGNVIPKIEKVTQSYMEYVELIWSVDDWVWTMNCWFRTEVKVHVVELEYEVLYVMEFCLFPDVRLLCIVDFVRYDYCTFWVRTLVDCWLLTYCLAFGLRFDFSVLLTADVLACVLTSVWLVSYWLFRSEFRVLMILVDMSLVLMTWCS